MPLILPDLINEIGSFSNPESSNFTGYPETIFDAANKWADAIDSYTSEIVPPTTTRASAKATLISSLNAINVQSGNAIVVMQTALTAYASTLATGMQPSFTGVPPILPLVITPVSVLGMSGASNEEVISLLCNIIHTWFKTGTATSNVNGATVTWN